MKTNIILTAIIVSLSALCAEAQDSQPSVPEPNQPKTVSEAYPSLGSAALGFAKPAELPKGVRLRAGEFKVTQADLDAEIAKVPEAVREQFRKNAFFLLEQMAARKLLLAEARTAMSKAGRVVSAMTDRQIIGQYLESVVKDVKVTDKEIKAFYDENRDMVGGATFEQVKKEIRQYLLGQKKQAVVNQHVGTLGKRTRIQVDATWTAQQAKLAADNPVDNARASGKPTFANFGAKGCVPCDMMGPVREAIRKKYEGKLNVVFVHVGNDQILASRYGVQGIPLLVFFDAKGNEVFRHTGFFPQEKIEKKLAEMGLK